MLRSMGDKEEWIKTGAAYRKEKGEAKNKEKEEVTEC